MEEPTEIAASHEAESGIAFASAWAPDSSRLAVAGLGQGVRVIDAEQRVPHREIPLDTNHYSCVDWSNDSTLLAMGNSEGHVIVLDAATGKRKGAVRLHSDEVRDVSFSPNGALVASAGNDGVVSVVSVDDMATVIGRGRHGALARSVRWNPAGSHLVSAGHDGVVRIWRASPFEPAGGLADHEGFVTMATFSPSGQQIASSGVDSTVRIWDLRSQKYHLTISDFEGWWVTGLCFSPDGHHLLTIDQDPGLRCFRVADGHRSFARSLSYGSVHANISPNGNLIAVGAHQMCEILRSRPTTAARLPPPAPADQSKTPNSGRSVASHLSESKRLLSDMIHTFNSSAGRDAREQCVFAWGRTSGTPTDPMQLLRNHNMDDFGAVTERPWRWLSGLAHNAYEAGDHELVLYAAFWLLTWKAVSPRFGPYERQFWLISEVPRDVSSNLEDLVATSASVLPGDAVLFSDATGKVTVNDIAELVVGMSQIR